MNIFKLLFPEKTPPEPVRNPYVVGGWVSGARYYGNVRLRHNLLHGSNDYLWVIGTRRVGKTSLLRQLAEQADSEYIPIYWDMQGCQTDQDLSQELFYAIEDQRKRFAKLGFDINTLEGASVGKLLREICRVADEHKQCVLLLIDEPEVLIPLAKTDPVAARRLRSALQRPTNLRVIMASTKSLARLHDVSQDWPTSSFLHIFAPRYLSGLAPHESDALIRQSQSDQPIRASDKVVEAIQYHTNNHPYLLQWLCYHLFEDDGSLRMPTDADLTCDAMLDSLFTLKYRHLSPTERRIMLYVHEAGTSDSQTLARDLVISPEEMTVYLYDLTRLGYTRRVEDGTRITIGDSLLEHWLDANADELSIIDTEVSDASVQEIAAAGREEEEALLQRQLQRHRINLAHLELKAAGYGAYPPLYIQNEIDIHKKKIRSLEQRLDALHA